MQSHGCFFLVLHDVLWRNHVHDTMSDLRCCAMSGLRDRMTRMTDDRSRSSRGAGSVRIFRSASSLPTSREDDRNMWHQGMPGIASQAICSSGRDCGVSSNRRRGRLQMLFSSDSQGSPRSMPHIVPLSGSVRKPSCRPGTEPAGGPARNSLPVMKPPSRAALSSRVRTFS